MKIKVKLTQSELLEVKLSTCIRGEKEIVLNTFYLTEGEAYSLLRKLDNELLKCGKESAVMNKKLIRELKGDLKWLQEKYRKLAAVKDAIQHLKWRIKKLERKD